MTSTQAIRWILKPAVFLGCLGPGAWLVRNIVTGNLSANPLEDITHATGIWALRFLCITLAVTPLRRVSGWHSVIRFRRLLGLFAFFYGTIHLLIYIVADRIASLGFPSIAAWQPFITIGFAAWVCMVPLAATSTAGMIRRLGGRRWNQIHRLIYASAIAGVVHFWWLVKSDVREPATYAVLVGGLLAFRIAWAVRGR